jgi:hypothetical protein
LRIDQGDALHISRHFARHATILPILLAFFAGSRAAAQDTPPEPPPIHVFMDCQAEACDGNYFRTQIGFVSWVRDRTEADVHVLITGQGTGGGGTQYALTFIGLRSFNGDTLQLKLATAQTTSYAVARDLLTNRIAQGLLRYAANTSGMERVLVKMREADEDATPNAAGAEDPWNHWVFETGFSASADGESKQSSRSFDMDLGAERVTEVWKFGASLEGSYNEDHYELDEGPLTVIRRNYSTDLEVTKALAALWSAGLEAEEGTSTFRNQKLYVRVAPVLEYSFLPYSDFARRRITLQYSVGVNHFDYEEVTLFDRLHETVYDERLTLGGRFQQTWGSASAELSGSHYFHDLKRYEVSGNANVDVRLFKGLSAELSTRYSRVHNQLYIQKGASSDEDVLLELRALATGYEYRISAGLRYTFGSIYNNIVNRRID